MYRDHFKFITNWFNSTAHKPLVLRGARQVGKSTLVRIFAEQHHLELAELNFERNFDYADLFKSNDPKQIVINLRLLLNKSIEPGKAILFLDEIQAAPNVLASLRYFQEEMPELHVIAAGSLLDFELASPSFSMPVGRISYLHLYPMNFNEFLRAVGEESLAEFIGTWQIADDIPLPIHNKLMGLLRQCMAVGGMPEAVKSFAEFSDYRKTEEIKQNLLATFSDDFAKYARHQDQNLIRMSFGKAPTLIGKKLKYSEISRDFPTPRIAQALNQLEKARVINKVIRTAANGIPLAAEENVKFFKLLFLDVGLVSTMLNISWQTLHEDIMLINRGGLAEQWVGQELLSSFDSYAAPHLHYWAREARSSSAELDYVIEGSSQPIPIEVKAGKSGALKSLQLFMKEKQPNIAVRFNADLPSVLDDTYKLLSLPLYMSGQLRRLVGIQ